MVFEYRCSCGFRTIFRNKYLSHVRACDVREPHMREARRSGAQLETVEVETGSAGF